MNPIHWIYLKIHSSSSSGSSTFSLLLSDSSLWSILNIQTYKLRSLSSFLPCTRLARRGEASNLYYTLTQILLIDLIVTCRNAPGSLTVFKLGTSIHQSKLQSILDRATIWANTKLKLSETKDSSLGRSIHQRIHSLSPIIINEHNEVLSFPPSAKAPRLIDFKLGRSIHNLCIHITLQYCRYCHNKCPIS